MDRNEQQNFFDPKTLIAIALVGIIWFGWQSYLNKKYPAPVGPQVTSETISNSPEGETNRKSDVVTQEVKTQDATSVATSKEEELISYSNENFKFNLSSKGMALKSLTLLKYSDRSGDPIVLGVDENLATFQTVEPQSLKPIDFEITKLNDHEFVGVANYQGGQITKKLKINSELYLIDVEVKTEGMATLSHVFSEFAMPEDKEYPYGKKVSVIPGEALHYLVVNSEGKNREDATSEDPLEKNYSQVSMGALSNRYFSIAMLDHSTLSPTFETLSNKNANILAGKLTHTLNSENQQFKMHFFAGPRSYKVLSSIDNSFINKGFTDEPRAKLLVDYGFFTFFALPLLQLMTFLNGFLMNWGWSIVLLTVIVRLVVLPFNVMAFKSMKKMQVIQPQINALRERHKDDPTRLNQEMMTLMKVNKVNPLGGCLPMLLQLPVFFALYQVLDHSVELYKAPFVLWIHDLSLKDPYFVLPVLMGLTMFIQQKLTPSTLDPMQAKILMFMPIIFTLFMVSLPSGLTLYIFVSTLFGIIQQLILLRDSKGTAVIAAGAQTKT